LRLIIATGVLALVSFTLGGCGGGDSVTQNPFATANDTAPTARISGAPATSVTVGSKYVFTPSASDSDGGTMTFSITNAPSWVSFNTTTGELSGTPKITDVGTVSGIVITVADGAAKASLPAFSITVSSTASASGTGSARLAWLAPTKNVNGTALTDLAGYNIYYGTDSGALTQTIQVSNPAALSYVVSGLATGTTWYFTVTSYTAAGEESAPSPISSKTI
jgi:putative Ig domain-containing protein